jgi:hypothetical protein
MIDESPEHAYLCRVQAAAEKHARGTDPGRVKKHYTHPEHDLQVEVARLLDRLGLVWFHCPNEQPAGEGYARMAYAMRQKAEGRKSGVPDILIFTPPPLIPGRCGCAIELKSNPIKELEGEQLAWKYALMEQHWVHATCWMIDMVETSLRSCGYLR